MRALPEQLIHVRPVLSAGYAWALMGISELEAAEPYLQIIEGWLGTIKDSSDDPDFPSSKMVVVNEAEFQSLPATIATARAYLAQTLGNMDSCVEYSQQALTLLPKDDYIKRAVPASLLGLTYWANGDLDAAYRAFSEVVTSFQMAGNGLSIIDLSYAMADIRATQGRLREALREYQQALRIATNQDKVVVRGTANLYTGIGALYLEWNDLAAAIEQLQIAQALDERATLPDWQYRDCLLQARIKEIQGDLDDALDLLDNAERVYYRSPLPDARPVAALRARLWAKQGRADQSINLGERTTAIC